MSNKTRIFILGGLVLIITTGIGYYNIKSDTPKNNEENIPVSSINNDKKPPEVPIADSDTKKGITDITKPNNTINVPVNQAVALMSVPDLDRPIIFYKEFSVEKKDLITTDINNIITALRRNLDSFNEWADLALLLKIVGDYEGARDMWEYAGYIRPGNALTYNNLGNLYGYYLHDSVKAEINFLQAIENNPKDMCIYARLIDFYVEVLNDEKRARQFLERSIEKYPEQETLKQLLGNL